MRFRRTKSSTAEASKALFEAQKKLKEVQDRTPEVRRVSEALRETRERNHFSEQLQIVMRRDIINE